MGTKAGKIAHTKLQTIEELRAHVEVDFTTDEIQEWYEDFESRLEPGQKELTAKQFKEVYASLFHGDATEFAEHVFRSFDENRNGTVDFKEFIIGLCISGSTNVQNKLRWAFNMYDINGDGFITKDEMQQIIKAVYKMMNCMTSAQLKPPEHLTEELFRSVDCNQDQKISWEEFQKGASKMQLQDAVNLLQMDPNPDEG
ncbi:hypothetical protein CHS0354_006487 [Potamilus streckersoni]|uniref:EF-hand domain-containing protein n=1 Tax=Potamilus streckersoni TaxID=2493646 RepID=A0AAE0VE95_9BIVA|nr:hypothetical protein CHS0354_006487 [Potamilus streckersoni]